jgi:hypothetical protein
MNVKELRARVEVELEAAIKRQDKARAEIQLIHDTASQEGRSNLTEGESARVKALFDGIDLAKVQEAGVRTKLANVIRLEGEEAEVETRASENEPTRAASTLAAAQANRGTAHASIGYEARTYRKDTDPTGRQFLQDVCRQFLYQDVQAASRLSQHMQEERVERAAYLTRAAGDTTTANWSGLVVPQYLVDMVAPAVANLRPFADAATNKHPLPADGMSVNISRVTTPSQAGLQTAELATVPTQSLDDTLLTIPVQTAAGFQNVSRQAIDRGTGIEDTVMQDLFSRYVTDLDNQLINQATTGLSNVAASVTWTQATPTGAQLYGQIQSAASNVEAAMLAMGQPSHVIMHSRRWYWFSAQMSNNYPMVNYPNIPVMTTGVGTASGYAAGVRGYLPNGLAVVVDNNISTTTGGAQDLVFVVPDRECHLWEDPNAPAFIRAEQPNATQLGVLLVVYGYYAYTFQRYTGAIQKLTGSGLVTPVFPG